MQNYEKSANNTKLSIKYSYKKVETDRAASTFEWMF